MNLVSLQNVKLLKNKKGGKNMEKHRYPNLEAEIARKGFSKNKYGEMIGRFVTINFFARTKRFESWSTYPSRFVTINFFARTKPISVKWVVSDCFVTINFFARTKPCKAITVTP